MSPLAPGQIVRVRDDWPEARGPVHIRTPHYLRGHTGTVLALTMLSDGRLASGSADFRAARR